MENDLKTFPIQTRRQCLGCASRPLLRVDSRPCGCFNHCPCVPGTRDEKVQEEAGAGQGEPFVRSSRRPQAPGGRGSQVGPTVSRTRCARETRE